MKDTTTSLAKISRPVLKEVLLRERLFSRLDESMDLPVIWISGPPGSGKTTLVSSYIESRGAQSLWYQVDSGDAEAATFFHYMALAAKKAAPRRRKPLPAFTPEFLQRLSVFTRRFFQDLFGRLKTFSIVVLDNYQDALNAETFNGILRDALTEVPDSVTVIIISHNDPPAVFARMRAYHQLELIGWDELRLTIDESKELVSQRDGTKLSDEMVQDLQEKTQGWAAGLVLLLERMKVEGLGTELMAGPTPELIFDYFIAEIFGKLDSSTRDFLLQSALLPNMTEKMARELTQFDNASFILSDLARRNCFTQRHVQNKLVQYQYHYLFRQFLLNRGVEEFGSERLSELKVTAAGILVDNGQIDAAAELLTESGRWNNLVELIRDAAPDMIRDGRHATVERWISSLPADMLEDDAWLCYLMGSCRMPFSPVEGISHFEKAYEVFKSSNNLTGMVRVICNVLITITAEAKDCKRGVRWVETLEGLLKESCAPLPRELDGQVTSSVFYTLSRVKPEHHAFDIWLERAQKIVDEPGDPHLQMIVGSNLILHYIWTGDLPSAAVVIDVMRRLPVTNKISPLIIARKISAEQSYYLFATLNEECIRTGEKGVEHARQSGVLIWEAQYHLVNASLAISSGDLERAQHLFDSTSECLSTVDLVNNFQRSSYHCLLGHLALEKGNILLSKLNLEKGLKYAHDAGVLSTEVINLAGMTQVLHEAGDEAGAKKYLKETRELGRRMNSQLFEFQCLIAEAQFALDRDEYEEGIKALTLAFALGRKGEYGYFVWWRPKVMARLCVCALEAGIEVEYVRELIKKRNLYPETPPLDVEQWPWPVRIYTLGRFEVLIYDKPLKFSGKTPKKPMEMLKTLVAFGGRDVGETLISDALWPDADGDEGHNAFTTTLRRLRKLIGIEDVLELVDGKLTLDPRKCWVDYTAVDRLLEKAETTKGGSDVGYVEKAAALYRGSFMEGEDAGRWAAPLSERLKQRLVRNIGDTARMLEKSNEHKRAVRLYKLGIEVDEFTEAFYHRLMLYYISLERKAKAVEVYKCLNKTLSVNLGISPSDTIKNLYGSLLDE